MNDAAALETPSGKDVAYENFPVGSWLLPAPLRPHVAVFYAYARAIDDIADDPDLGPQEKLRRLDRFGAALTGGDASDPALATARRMRESLAQTAISERHCLDLLAAFSQDATKLRYDDWDDLVAYCMLSAAPVGRYLLDLHGGSKDGYGPADALCVALQIINHLQDCQDDYRQLDRVYLPLDWMAEAGARVEDLDAGAETPALRVLLDRVLDGTEELLGQARPLPSGLASRRLALESAFTIDVARTLARRLRRHDVLRRRVQLTRAGYVLCGVRGVVAGLLGR